MYPAQIVVEALQKAGSVQDLAHLMAMSDQTIRNWLNFASRPSDDRLMELMSITVGLSVKKPAAPVQKPYKAEPQPPARKAWKQKVEITRIHPNADFAFGVTNDALITFIVPHVADKLKDAGFQNGDEVTLVVRENEHHAADLYAFKWIEDDEDGY